MPATITHARSPLAVWTEDFLEVEIDKKSEASNDIVPVAPQSKIQWGSFGPDVDVEEHVMASKEFLQGIDAWDITFSEGWGLICKVLAMWGPVCNNAELWGMYLGH